MSLLGAEHSLKAGAGILTGFVADRTRRVPLEALSAPEVPGLDPAKMHRRSVLVTVTDPLQAIVALVQLAGVARRIVLWPQDQPWAGMTDVIEAANIEIVVTECGIPGRTAKQEPGLAAAKPDPASHHSRNLGQGAGNATEWVLLTSGTTGRPKLVVHSLDSLSGHLRRGAQAEDGIVWCTFYNLCRYGGLQILLRALTGGGSLLLPPSPAEPLDDFLAWAARAGATHFLGTPTHWRKVLMSPSAGELRPRYIRLSGEVVDQSILDRLHQAYPAARLVHAFASTEAGLAFEVDDARAGVSPGLLDRPWQPGISIRLAEGSLQVCSAGVARGYLEAGGIRPIAGRDGFVDTGDQLLLRDGRLHFDGRRDQVVNIGGRKVHPAQVEAVINSHPAVRMSRVQGRVSPIMGSLVTAEVVCDPWFMCGRAASAGEMQGLASDIAAFCRKRLAAHEVPATIRIVPSIAVAPSGKLARPHA